ncbi:MAG: ABC transporter substrate-binding protein [Ilumatobacteraceae bacterium]
MVIPHRRRRRNAVAICLLAILGLVAAACSGKSPNDGAAAGTNAGTATPGSATSGEHVLRLAFAADMDPPDPDTNYQLQGNQVTTALYEGLLDYAPDSTNQLVGLLAESWTVSPDGLTYTFTLRDGLKFSDGTPLTSESLRAGFDRRTAADVKSPMSYMLLPVAGYDTPDATTFVIHLSHPESAFLTYLASPFSPKAINPSVLQANAADDAIEYLKTHSAGTGPYEISEFVLGQRYVLTRNENYWGPKPYYDKVQISIVPDPAAQILQLQGGDLDIVTGQPVATMKTFEGRKDFQVIKLPVLQKAWLHINTGRAPTDDVAVRQAIRAAIDRPKLVQQIWGDYATESTQMYPVDNLPAGMGTDSWTYDPSLLKAMKIGTIEIGYSPSLPVSQQVAETLQAQLEAAGASVQLRPVQDADLFSFQTAPDTAPHLYFETSYPDSAHPDTWSRLFWYSDVASGNGGFLNYLGAGTPDADTAMDDGLVAIDQSTVDADYGRSADLVHDQVGYVTLADPADAFIVRAGITGFSHWLPTPMTLQLKTLQGG